MSVEWLAMFWDIKLAMLNIGLFTIPLPYLLPWYLNIVTVILYGLLAVLAYSRIPDP